MAVPRKRMQVNDVPHPGCASRHSGWTRLLGPYLLDLRVLMDAGVVGITLVGGTRLDNRFPELMAPNMRAWQRAASQAGGYMILVGNATRYDLSSDGV